MLPFGVEEFLGVFGAYNRAIWPLQIVAYGLGGVMLLAALRPRPASGRLVAWGLAVLWGWNGAFYHGLFFRAINPAALGFAAAFLVQAMLLVRLGPHLRIAGPGASRRRLGIGLALYALAIYPLLGLVFGHSWPNMPAFGLTPCPTTIFTLGLFLLAERVPVWALAIPLAWSLIGGSAALLLGMPEDAMLPVAAVLAAVLVPRRANG